MLKHSARNWRLFSSVKWKSLITEKSTSATPGPINVFRPKLPKVPRGCGTNEHGSKYMFGVPTGVPAATPVHPRETPLVGLVLAPATRFGRSEELAPERLVCERV